MSGTPVRPRVIDSLTRGARRNRGRYGLTVRRSAARCTRYVVAPLLAIAAVTAGTVALSSSESAHAGVICGTVRLHSTGDCAADVQRVLNESLRAGLVVDGRSGPRTPDAVVRFQRSRRLHADGVVGPRTWTALHRADCGGTSC